STKASCISNLYVSAGRKEESLPQLAAGPGAARRSAGALPPRAQQRLQLLHHPLRLQPGKAQRQLLAQVEVPGIFTGWFVLALPAQAGSAGKVAGQMHLAATIGATPAGIGRPVK